MTFARHQFELSKPQEDGTPLLVHLQLASEKSGKLHPMLANGPTLPKGAKQLWDEFLQLHGSRGSSGWGPQRITFVDIDAWQRVNGVTFEPWEISAIRKLDDIWLSEFAPKPKGEA